MKRRADFCLDFSQGFYARPAKAKDGSGLDLLNWEVGIPGKPNVCLAAHIVKATLLTAFVSTNTDAMGRRIVQVENVLSRRVPIKAAQVQI